MREIKIRGRRQQGLWYYGSLDLTGSEPMICFIDSIMDDGESRPFTRRVAVYESTVGQFTGLLDRNGKEIYEGDILSFTDKGGKEYRREVVFYHGCFKLRNLDEKLPDTPMCHHLQFNKLNWEVIGNIHDHDFTPKKKEK